MMTLSDVVISIACRRKYALVTSISINLVLIPRL